MIDLAAFLSALRERDVRLWVEGDRLRCSAPVGALDAETQATLVSRRPEILDSLRQVDLKRYPPTIIPIKPEGRSPPIFVVSGHGGDVFYFVTLARHLGADQPLLGVQPPGLDGGEAMKSVETLARYEVEQIRRYRPEGPYLILGHCAGGTLAFETAQQLTAAGQKVALLALLGCPFPTMFRHTPQMSFRLRRIARALTSGSLSARQRFIKSALQRRLQEPDLPGIGRDIMAARRRVEGATLAAVRRYKPRRYSGLIDLFITSDEWHLSRQWRSVADCVREHDLGYGINDLLLGPHVAVLAAPLQDRLNQIKRDIIWS